MITVNDIILQFQSLKARINEFYTAITGEVNADANLDGLTSTSKTAEFNLWMYMFSIMCVIMDGIWNDRQKQIEDTVARGIPGTDPWFQLELMKFQYGDSLSWDPATKRYYYAVIDATKQIIARCAVVSLSGFTAVKVAKLDSGGAPIALTNDELTAFITYVRQIQWSGSSITAPVSFNADKLKAPMTVYYDGTKKLDDIKDIVEEAWEGYLKVLPFNGEYSVNKHGDFIENASADIREVNMGVVQAKTDAGSYNNVTRIYSPVSGYLVKDAAISYDSMITYVPV